MNMARRWYMLNENKEPVPTNVMEATKWLGLQVAWAEIGDVKISTIFLGLDHQLGDGPPLLFETMILGGKHDQDQWRYHTWDEAMEGHKAAVKLVSGS